MTPTAQRDIWQRMGMEKGINPADSAAATINGTSIERNPSSGRAGAASAVLHVACGAATGGPSSFTVNGKLQDSADGSTGWADIGDAITALTSDDTDGESPGSNMSNFKAHIRAVIVVAFVGGSTPTIPVAATVCFGGRD